MQSLRSITTSRWPKFAITSSTHCLFWCSLWFRSMTGNWERWSWMQYLRSTTTFRCHEPSIISSTHCFLWCSGGFRSGPGDDDLECNLCALLQHPDVMVPLLYRPLIDFFYYPLALGLGLGMMIVNAIFALYHNLQMAWVLYYLVNSFRSPLPWSVCGSSWNTEYCFIKVLPVET